MLSRISFVLAFAFAFSGCGPEPLDLTTTAPPRTTLEVEILTATTIATSAHFGRSAAISGDYAIVGAPDETEFGNANAGAAYIFQRNSSGTWGNPTRIVSNFPYVGANFGYSVAIAPPHVLVGSPGVDSVQFFALTSTGNTWVFSNSISAAAGIRFGHSVALHSTSGGSFAAIGAPRYTGTFPNVGYFYFAAHSGTWPTIPTPLALGFAATGGDSLGWSVGIGVGSDGNTYAVAGAPFAAGTPGNGYAVVCQLGPGYCVTTTTLSVGGTTNTDYFGLAVAMSGNQIVVGAPGTTGSTVASTTGHVYTFNRTGTNTWGNVKTTTASDNALDNAYGRALALDSGKLVVGSRTTGSAGGKAFWYSSDGIGGWSGEVARQASDSHPNNAYGWAVGTHAGRSIVGAYQQNVSGTSQAGAAYVYE